MADPAPPPAGTCPDCRHPWANHVGGTCTVWPKGERPCTCKREPPQPPDDGGRA